MLTDSYSIGNKSVENPHKTETSSTKIQKSKNLPLVVMTNNLMTIMYPVVENVDIQIVSLCLLIAA